MPEKEVTPQFSSTTHVLKARLTIGGVFSAGNGCTIGGGGEMWVDNAWIACLTPGASLGTVSTVCVRR